MARSKAKASSKAAPKSGTQTPGPTAGFYKKNLTGNALHFAPTAVHYPGGSLLVAQHAEYTYPVYGWTYYENAEAAYAAEGLPMPEPAALATRPNITERISARRAMTREEREAERAQRDAERIARIEATHPERAAQLRARAEQRQERMAQREALRAMPPEERKAARLSELQKKNPELAARLATRPST